MRPHGKLGAWLALGLARVLLVAAFSSVVREPDGDQAASEMPVPVASEAAGREPKTTTPGVSDEPDQATPHASQEAEPTVTVGDVSEAEDRVLTEDDRSVRLKSIRADWNTNWNKHNIGYDELLSGGPPRDGIPSIDEPRFADSEEAAGWLADNEPVIALEIGGDARAYPLPSLTWHEIVGTVSQNGVDVAYPLSLFSEAHVVEDALAEVDLLIWHPPGTSSALGASVIAEAEDIGAPGVLDPTLNGRKLSFRFEDGVFVDAETGSSWNVLGQAVDGALEGESLEPIIHGNHFWFA